MQYILAIDQGTTSSRAIVFDAQASVVGTARQEFPQIYPASGLVEHDPEDLWRTVVQSAREAVARTGIDVADIAAIGITNQRETTLVWDRATGKPIHNAIVWQDRRTAPLCAALRDAGHEPLISRTTGLLLDPYFSATKLRWILDHVDGAKAKAARGELAFGTVDSFLIWRLTGGRVHATDATNAARTMLFDIRRGAWDHDICNLLDIHPSLLPQVYDCAADFGETTADLLGRAIPIAGVAGDQQAAALGQACFTPGMMKSTYGTGCFALLNTGERVVESRHRLLTTIAAQIDGRRTYALEGSIFVAGAVVQWLRDGLGVIASAGEVQGLAESADTTQEVVLVPAFTGLGAPYWRPDCRGAVFGLTRSTGPAELARAALASVGFQTRDLLEAMVADWAEETGTATTPVLRVDGGMSASDWAMQFLADITGAVVDRPQFQETTALGVAWLAGMRTGLYPDAETFAKHWALDRSFLPRLAAEVRDEQYRRWKKAVAAAISMENDG
ncbi:glycerol kinase GlpK [Pseudochelatococcus lubricantis]|uniref:glycerol kinase GlpK n=1 Tax=Pseudochelatococcus lubricantis TaxID=1538102 RepID=UPI0035E51205